MTNNYVFKNRHETQITEFRLELTEVEKQDLSLMINYNAILLE